MDADALLHPRGPLPPGVYWRRRAVTLLVVVVVLFALTRACGSDGEPTASVRPTGSPSPTAAGTRPPRASGSPTRAPTAAPTSAAAGAPCRPVNLVVNARAGAQVFAAGQRPVLTIGVRNTGDVPCTLDVGQAQREIRVSSGNDRVWSSDDCSPGGAPEVVTLAPGTPKEFSVTWSRKRSAPGCPGGMRDAAPGTYRVVGRFGDLESEPDSFSLR